MNAVVEKLRPKLIVLEVVPIFHDLYGRIEGINVGEHEYNFGEVIEMLRSVEEDPDWRSLAGLTSRREVLRLGLWDETAHDINKQEFSLEVVGKESSERRRVLEVDETGENRDGLHILNNKYWQAGDFYLSNVYARGTWISSSGKERFGELLPKFFPEVLNRDTLRNALLDHVRFGPHNDSFSSYLREE